MGRKMGMLLMAIGVLCFITGFIFYSKSKNSTDTANQFVEKGSVINPSTDESDVPPSTSIAGTDNSLSSSNSSNSSTNSNELARIIDMAIADGVLTPNERSLIKEIANSNNLDYDAIIQDVEKRIVESGVSETEIIDVNKRSGDDFEKYVVQKFDRGFFKIKEWAGDKYVNGRYAQTTQHPDLLLEFQMKGQTFEFAVECKWKSNFYKRGIEFATPEQFKRYQSFQSEKNIPVFIAIGVKGTGNDPEELFIVPLKEIDSNFIPLTILNKYKRYSGKNFFFDTETGELK
ncbi:hypothetical protein [Pontibacter sp. BAB1700]|uniref:hypothetical protein n=1 Tax=Pontibacter sp. BAB1700 TaxID=1144253 RepID=UPI00026BC5BD|nr:hypothetical protein [Pontibacter sp. BAB1700]EJF09218.1 hypothetical protein O71_16391 [Pontibacter sp. BAB1700]